MVLVEPGQCPDAVRRQEFALVQHVAKRVAQLVRIHNREEPALTISRSAHASNVGGQVVAVFDKPVEPALEIWQAVEQFRLQGLHREERNQSHHGADLHRFALAVRQVQHVVEETVLIVPHGLFAVTAMAHGVGDVEEVLPEFAGDIFIHRIFTGEFQSDGQHVERVHGHPGRAVGLFDVAPGRERRAAVEDANVVEPQEAALEYVHAFRVLAVYPPGEVEHELLENALKERAIAAAVLFLINLVDTPRGPRVDGRIHVTERPFIGRKLSVRMHVPLTEEENELFLREIGIDKREGYTVEREIPRRIPGVFPFVGHGDDVGVEHMRPIAVAAAFAPLGRSGLRRIAAEPVSLHVVIKLLGPEESRERLAQGVAAIGGEGRRSDGSIELIGFL